MMPPVVASPNGNVAELKSPHVAPPSALAVRFSGFTRTPRTCWRKVSNVRVAMYSLPPDPDPAPVSGHSLSAYRFIGKAPSLKLPLSIGERGVGWHSVALERVIDGLHDAVDVLNHAVIPESQHAQALGL